MLSFAAAAQDLTLGLAGALTSLDPHAVNSQPNASVAAHIFDRLIVKDERLRLQPGLAVEWSPVDGTTWEFRLRRGVKFHNGGDFAAEDVAASLRRLAALGDSAPFRFLARRIAGVDVLDPYTVRIRTAGPFPLLPQELAGVPIVSRKFEQAPTAEFNGGRALDGSGPYHFVEHVPGDRLVLARNDAYWGAKPAWARVIVKFIPNDGARAAALMADEVQLIDQVAPAVYAKLKASPEIEIAKTASNRVIYLALDSFRDQSPYVTDKAGAMLPNNPLRDARVRRALSKAINRPMIAEKLMEGLATPAAGLLAEGFAGVSPLARPEGFDPEGARKLLAEAGYPNGFGLTIHGPNDRYINDEKILQTIGPMFGRVGVDTRVVTQPWAAYLTQMNAPTYAYSVMLSGWAAETGDVSSPLRALVATPDRSSGFGDANRGRYSNPKFDALLRQALGAQDSAKREAQLKEAADMALADTAIIPIDFPLDVWASRKGVAYVPRADDYTLAQSATPRK